MSLQVNLTARQVLEDILRSHEDDADYQKVPSLGKHYSIKWAQEDMLEEQREGISISCPLFEMALKLSLYSDMTE